MLFKKFIISFFIITLLFTEVMVKAGTLSPIAFQILFNGNIDLKKTDSNRINFLILGIGGQNHDGPNLSDTIIFASFDLKNPKITLVSLPRDIWSTDINAKINTAYAKGELKRQGGGLVLAKSVVTKITGQPIDYVFVIDFSGFTKAIDQLGGLEIDVENSFSDPLYPAEGKADDLCGRTNAEADKFIASNSAEIDIARFFPCRYIKLDFKKGPQVLDGETALKFVRSRHATGEEGTDFARSKRQEKVIEAIKERAFSIEVFNPTRILGLYNTLDESINTDINNNELDDFIKLGQKFKNSEIESIVIDNGDLEDSRGGLLTHPDITKTYNYEWVLIPRAGRDNYSEIHEYIRCRLVRTDCIISEIP